MLLQRYWCSERLVGIDLPMQRRADRRNQGHGIGSTHDEVVGLEEVGA